MQEKITYVQWLYGNVCNYNCSYCPIKLHSGSVRYNRVQEMENHMQYVVSNLRLLDREPAFSFVGGEPTLNPALMPMLQRTGNKKLRNRLVTNGSAGLKFWEEHYHYFHTIEISSHPEFADLEHIKEVVHYLQHEDRPEKVYVDIAVHVTHDDAAWLKGVQAYEQLAKEFYDNERVWVHIKLLYSNFTRGKKFFPYKTYQMEYWHKSKGMNFNADETMYKGNLKYDGRQRARHDFDQNWLSRKQNIVKKDWNFKGYNCYAGEDTLVIDHLGEVWRGWCKVGNSLGNLSKRNVNFDPGYIQCTKNTCRNGHDQVARKFK